MSKTYAEYLAENKKKTFSTHMMPPSARPGRSQADTQEVRERIKDMRSMGVMTIETNKDNSIATHSLQDKVYDQ